MLPFARQDKWWNAALFSFITMVSFDLLTGMVGIWTLVTALTYAGLGILFHQIYKNKKKINLKTYLGSGIIGVLIFDFITGPIMSSWMFQLPFEFALIGQIPFTLLHLVSVSVFIVILTPLLDVHLMNSSHLEDQKVWNKLLSFSR
jgi:multisubunit Na+/H+ antiporter MnhG subunit